MIPALAVLLVLHGLLHLLGVAKAFGWAELSQLTRPISYPVGMLWLVAAVLFALTAVTLFASPRWSWVVGVCAVLVSIIAIVPSWDDAKAGLIVNGVVLVALWFLRVR